jgi:hypothetical protein
MPPLKSDHQLHDLKSLQAHRIIARKLRQNPELLQKAIENLEAAKEVADIDALKEWEVVLRAPISKICEFMVRNTETATRMRQSSPFSGLLSEQERESIDEKIKPRAADSSSSLGHG